MLSSGGGSSGGAVRRINGGGAASTDLASQRAAASRLATPRPGSAQPAPTATSSGAPAARLPAAPASSSSGSSSSAGSVAVSSSILRPTASFAAATAATKAAAAGKEPLGSARSTGSAGAASTATALRLLGGGGAAAAAASAAAAATAALAVKAGGRLGAVGTRPPTGQLPGVALRAGGTDSRGTPGLAAKLGKATAVAPKEEGSASASSSSSSSASTASSSSSSSTALTGGGGSSSAAATASSAVGGGTPVAGQGLCPHGFVRKERFAFTLDDLSVSTTVGTGTFGRVCVTQHLQSGKWYALKILKKSEILHQRQLEHIKSEVRILSTVSHPFIVSFLGHMQNPRRLYMLFEYVSGGELFSHLRHEGVLREAAARFYASEIVLALEYLHGLDVAYRDLKPENLLLSASGHIKLTDFGFAKCVPDRTHSLCGTPEYLAPEIIQGTGHGKGVDWWALGILIYEMLAGYPPFNAETQQGIYAKICAGDIAWPKTFSPEAKNLITRLLCPDRSKRLGCLRGGASDVKDHPWFGLGLASGRMNWDKVYRGELLPPHVPRVRDASDTSNFDKYPDSDGETAKELSASDNALFSALEAL